MSWSEWAFTTKLQQLVIYNLQSAVIGLMMSYFGITTCACWGFTTTHGGIVQRKMSEITSAYVELIMKVLFLPSILILHSVNLSKMLELITLASVKSNYQCNCRLYRQCLSYQVFIHFSHLYMARYDHINILQYEEIKTSIIFLRD